MIADLVPYPAGTTAMRVRQGDRVLAERVVSATAPTVTVLSPSGGETFDDSMEVRWEYVDADGDALTFTVMYSDDSGENWLPLATDVSANAITLPSLEGIAGSGGALIRVMATDGVLTGYDDSDAAFSVADGAPKAYIAGPVDGASFTEGATVALVGGASDEEDGMLTSASLQWTSSVDGELGTGTQVTTRTLSRGEHEISLVARDSAGGTSEQTVAITIGELREGQPGEDERMQAAEYLVNGRDDDGGDFWFVTGIQVLIGAALVLAVGLAAVRFTFRRR
jgi:hypothetical protein